MVTGPDAVDTTRPRKKLDALHGGRDVIDHGPCSTSPAVCTRQGVSKSGRRSATRIGWRREVSAGEVTATVGTDAFNPDADRRSGHNIQECSSQLVASLRPGGHVRARPRNTHGQNLNLTIRSVTEQPPRGLSRRRVRAERCRSTANATTAESCGDGQLRHTPSRHPHRRRARCRVATSVAPRSRPDVTSTAPICSVPPHPCRSSAPIRGLARGHGDGVRVHMASLLTRRSCMGGVVRTHQCVDESVCGLVTLLVAGTVAVGCANETLSERTASASPSQNVSPWIITSPPRQRRCIADADSPVSADARSVGFIDVRSVARCADRSAVCDDEQLCRVGLSYRPMRAASTGRSVRDCVVPRSGTAQATRCWCCWDCYRPHSVQQTMYEKICRIRRGSLRRGRLARSQVAGRSVDVTLAARRPGCRRTGAMADRCLVGDGYRLRLLHACRGNRVRDRQSLRGGTTPIAQDYGRRCPPAGCRCTRASGGAWTVPVRTSDDRSSTFRPTEQPARNFVKEFSRNPLRGPLGAVFSNTTRVRRGWLSGVGVG